MCAIGRYETSRKPSAATSHRQPEALDRPADVGVIEHHALRRAGGARRVDDGDEISAGATCAAASRSTGSAPSSVVPRDGPSGSATVGLVDDHDVREVGKRRRAPRANRSRNSTSSTIATSPRSGRRGTGSAPATTSCRSRSACRRASSTAMSAMWNSGRLRISITTRVPRADAELGQARPPPGGLVGVLRVGQRAVRRRRPSTRSATAVGAVPRRSPGTAPAPSGRPRARRSRRCVTAATDTLSFSIPGSLARRRLSRCRSGRTSGGRSYPQTRWRTCGQGWKSRSTWGILTRSPSRGERWGPAAAARERFSTPTLLGTHSSSGSHVPSPGSQATQQLPPGIGRCLSPCATHARTSLALAVLIADASPRRLAPSSAIAADGPAPTRSGPAEADGQAATRTPPPAEAYRTPRGPGEPQHTACSPS